MINAKNEIAIVTDKKFVQHTQLQIAKTKNTFHKKSQNV
jgi:hypothetical protein